jgi:nicotinate-nucleotide adenylyltransferase
VKIIIFGGSFDPPHIGHIEMARYVLDDCDKLIIIPVGRSPLKQSSHVADSHHRFKMTELAFKDLSAKVLVSDFELKSKAESHSINSVEWLEREYPDSEFSMIIGDDQFVQLEQWYQIDKLLEKLSFICFNRSGTALNGIIPVNNITDFKMEVSSTQIRKQLKVSSQNSQGYLSPRVFKYINKMGLYR